MLSPFELAKYRYSLGCAKPSHTKTIQGFESITFG